MKEELKDILLMGLGAMSLTNEKAKELKDELLKAGAKVYEEGKVKNEELKHHIKENLSVVIKEVPATKEDLAEAIKSMTDSDKEELLSLLKDSDKDNKQVKTKDNNE